jgi:hypothetical protein
VADGHEGNLPVDENVTFFGAARNAIAGTGVIGAADVNNCKIRFTRCNTDMNWNGTQAGASMVRAAGFAGATEPCTIRIQIVNRWNCGVLLIPRLKVE